MKVGKQTCLVILSMITFAVFTAVGLETGYATSYIDKTSNVVITFS